MLGKAAARVRREHRDEGPYFHGGVPGLPMDGTLIPAQELGVTYQYLSRYAVHDPTWVYVTTDEGSAAAYASRYCASDGRSVPGDVYEVAPLDRPQDDPDYRGYFPGVFLRCRRARIIRRVASAVSLSPAEQLERERQYKVWESADDPVWDDDGVINPSRQMRGNGVTREWTSMLRPWLHPEDVDADGKLIIAFRAADEPAREGEPWLTILEVVPALDRDCQVQLATDRGARDRSYECLTCGRKLADRDPAIVHQLGEHAVETLTRIHGWDTPATVSTVLGQLTQAAIHRNRPRWQWLLDEL